MILSLTMLLRSSILIFGGAYVLELLFVEHIPGNTWKHFWDNDGSYCINRGLVLVNSWLGLEKWTNQA